MSVADPYDLPIIMEFKNRSARMSLTSMTEEEIAERAFHLCRDYLHGAWRTIKLEDMMFTRISGGLSNLLYHCQLPPNCEPVRGEPREVVLRIYGQVHGEHALESLVTESVIFTLLSEGQRGPRLFGVFPGGRLEEYIQARPLLTDELRDPELNVLIAEKMAQIHAMCVPISKEPTWLWKTIDRWVTSVEENYQFCEDNAVGLALVNQLASASLRDEMEWLVNFLSTIKSPVVFCHNDMQEGNILLREEVEKREEKLVVIDFEYCSYNYRGFDVANHFCEWTYNYAYESFPHFLWMPQSYPTKEQQLRFIRAYLHTLEEENKDSPPGSPSLPPTEKEEQKLLKEIKCFTLASHFFWGLWSVINAQVSQIPFGYWEYGQVRFNEYFRLKDAVLGKPSLHNGNGESS